MPKASALAKRSSTARAAGAKKAKVGKHDEHFYTIGDLSREFGVTLRTLRFMRTGVSSSRSVQV